jgi:hypothetical protein
MRRYWYKLFALLMAGAALPAFFLKCDKAALNFQRGFWQGLGDSLSDLLTDPLASCVG